MNELKTGKYFSSKQDEKIFQQFNFLSWFNARQFFEAELCVLIIAKNKFLWKGKNLLKKG
jgi:hypothetical protein